MLSLFKLKIKGFEMKKISPVQNYMSFSIIQMKKNDYCIGLQFKKSLNKGK